MNLSTHKKWWERSFLKAIGVPSLALTLLALLEFRAPTRTAYQLGTSLVPQRDYWRASMTFFSRFIAKQKITFLRFQNRHINESSALPIPHFLFGTAPVTYEPWRASFAFFFRQRYRYPIHSICKTQTVRRLHARGDKQQRANEWKVNKEKDNKV